MSRLARFAPLSILFPLLPLLPDLQDTWTLDGDYSHAPLVIAIALLLAYPALLPSPQRPSHPIGWLSLSIAVPLYLLGVNRHALPIALLAWLGILLAFAALLNRTDGIRTATPPLIYATLAIPLPTLSAWTAPLQRTSIQIAAALSRLLALPAAFSDDGLIRLPNGTLQVGAPCSGMRSTLALLTIAGLILLLTHPRSTRHLLLIPITPFIATISNATRITLLTASAIHLGTRPTLQYIHFPSGILTFACATLILMGIARQLGCHPSLPTLSIPSLSAPLSSPRAHLALFLLPMILAAAGLLLRIPSSPQPESPYTLTADIDTWWRTPRERTVTSPYNLTPGPHLKDLPTTIGPWTSIPADAPSEPLLQTLAPDLYLARLYRHPNGQTLWLTLLAGHQPRTFHPPEVCFSGPEWHTQTQSRAIPLTHGTLYVMETLVFQSHTNAPTYLIHSLYLWPTPERKWESGVVRFKITTPTNGDVEEARQTALGFLSLWFTRAK